MPTEDTYIDQEFDAPRRTLPWGRIALACVFAFLVLAAVLFVWNRWYRFDDALDFQGVWRDTSSGTSMEVDSEHIRLAADVVYDYTIDTAGKTIAYTFGSGSGTSSYRFSEDRKTLILEDSGTTDWGLVMHFRDDTAFTDATLPEGTSRLVKESDEAPTIVVPGSNREASSSASSTASTLLGSSVMPTAGQGSSSSEGTNTTGQSGAAGQPATGASDAAWQSGAGQSGAAGQAGTTDTTDAQGTNSGDDLVWTGYYDDNGNWVDIQLPYDAVYGTGGQETYDETSDQNPSGDTSEQNLYDEGTYGQTFSEGAYEQAPYDENVYDG